MPHRNQISARSARRVGGSLTNMKEKISFQEKLLYATTIALIVSNIATLVLTITFAKALEKNLENIFQLNRVNAGDPGQCNFDRLECRAWCEQTSPSDEISGCNSGCQENYRSCLRKPIMI